MRSNIYRSEISNVIITSSPLRITLGGDGTTDLPSYYCQHAGFLIAALDKYVCADLHEPFVEEVIVKYSKMEVVDNRPDVDIHWEQAKAADACVIIPTVNQANTTPHSEAFQALVCHVLVSHPDLKQVETM